jgi:lipopolysaccharide transport system ATP-binding protein
MSQIAVHGLGKAYRQYEGRWSRLLEWFDPRKIKYYVSHWVLRDINFEIEPGEAVALIGMNGSGKSTLLKMIAGTLRPSEGTVYLHGSVAALLELGMGFHPDFTGRQNVMMAGQLLGMQAWEIQELMPHIEAFAEIGSYIDQPVRVYSSGMQMRLAFSVATAKRPDILIVDEALSVGDAYFQHKSFERIRQLRAQGTTLLLVSHDKASVLSICDRAILLHDGAIRMQGAPEVVLDYYNALIAQKEDSRIEQHLVGDRVQTISGSLEARITNVRLLDEGGRAIEAVLVGQAVCLEVGVVALGDLPELVVGYQIKDRQGQCVFGTNSYYLGQTLSAVTAGSTINYAFDFLANLGEGSYSVTIALHASHSHTAHSYEWRDLALVFTVINADQPSFVGTNWMAPTLRITS